MPAVPPYSSTTTASCSPDSRSRVSRVSPSSDSGTVGTGWASVRRDTSAPARRRHAERLLDVDDADERVGIAAVVDGEAGEPRLLRLRDELGDGVVGVEGRDPHPRGHEVLGDAVGEAQRAVQQCRGALVERAALGAGAHEGAQLAGRARRAQLLGGLHAELAHDGVGHGVERADQPAERVREPALQPDDGPRRAQRVGDREVLGHELAEHHGQRRGQHQREHGGGGGRRTLGEAERGEAGHEQGGDRGLGDVAGDQRGDRDEELAGRQLEGQGAVGALHDAGLAVAPCGDVRVDLTALQRGERELGRDGHRGAQREDGDGEQAEQRTAGRS